MCTCKHLHSFNYLFYQALSFVVRLLKISLINSTFHTNVLISAVNTRCDLRNVNVHWCMYILYTDNNHTICRMKASMLNAHIVSVTAPALRGSGGSTRSYHCRGSWARRRGWGRPAQPRSRAARPSLRLRGFELHFRDRADKTTWSRVCSDSFLSH